MRPASAPWTRKQEAASRGAVLRATPPSNQDGGPGRPLYGAQRRIFRGEPRDRPHPVIPSRRRRQPGQRQQWTLRRNSSVFRRAGDRALGACSATCVGSKGACRSAGLSGCLRSQTILASSNMAQDEAPRSGDVPSTFDPIGPGSAPEQARVICWSMRATRLGRKGFLYTRGGPSSYRAVPRSYRSGTAASRFNSGTQLALSSMACAGPTTTRCAWRSSAAVRGFGGLTCALLMQRVSHQRAENGRRGCSDEGAHRRRSSICAALDRQLPGLDCCRLGKSVRQIACRRPRPAGAAAGGCRADRSPGSMSDPRIATV